MKHRFSFIYLLALLLGSLLLAGCARADAFLSAPVPVSGEQLIEPLLPADGAAADELESVAAEPAAVPTAPAESPATTAPALNNPDEAIQTLLAQQQALITLYEAVNPAVVNIATGSGQGSGFVYDADGHIITNNHVVRGAREIMVMFADGKERPATIVGTDPASDLAVIAVDPAGLSLTPVELADSQQLRVGQIVIAIGSPFGLSGTMTTGIISGLDRQFPGAMSAAGGQFLIPDVIQTDAAINPGNSGGPLLDLYGRVIGVNTAIESPVRGSSGIGYAVPANIVATVVPQLISQGEVQHPWLGIAGGTLTPAAAQQLGLPAEQQGILVSQVVPDGPAAVAGLRGGERPDVIVGVDGRPITKFDDLLGYVVQYTRVGQTINVDILRDGAPQTLTLTLGERPTE